MYEYEKTLYEKGIKLICGTDEAGRGPLAGPVVAGAVILDPDHVIEGLNDSKQLSAKTRERRAGEIRQYALAWGIGFVFEDEIDRINIYQASKLAMIKAIEEMKIQPVFILSDAMPLKETGIPHLPIIHGDALSASIAAASILAKTARDAYMDEMAKKYPQYGFEIHKGYPTKQHLEALEKYGPCPIHRKTYGPVKNRVSKQLSLDLWGETACR
jgi:ribonuclease HII